MDIKKEKFCVIKQGGMSVSDYLNKFTQLGHYALKDVATNEAKKSRFFKGLNLGLQVGLTTHNFPKFLELVNKALVLRSNAKN